MATKITNKEKAVLQGILDSEYQDGCEGEEAINREAYTFSIDPPEGCDRKSLPGIISSLVKKELAWVSSADVNGEGDETIAITAAGLEALKAQKPASSPPPAGELPEVVTSRFGATEPADRSPAKYEAPRPSSVNEPLSRARRIFDELSEEICYGLNFKLVVAELPLGTLDLLEAVLERIRKARK